MDQPVDPPEAVERGLDDRLAARLGRDRIGVGDGLAAGGPDRIDHVLRRAGIETVSPMMRTLASTALTASSAGLGTSVKDPVTGPVSMNAISLAPYGVYIGELAHQPGLESAPSPLRPASR